MGIKYAYFWLWHRAYGTRLEAGGAGLKVISKMRGFFLTIVRILGNCKEKLVKDIGFYP